MAPSRSTFRRVLRRLDGHALAAGFGAWLKAQVIAGLADAGALVIALDGKTVRGGLFAALDALDWQNTPIACTMRDRGHGRDETRTIHVLPVPDGPFHHSAQAFLIERTVRHPHDGQVRSAAALRITSRTITRGGTPEVLASAARGHWDIEVLHHA